jgi:hypothetical protein
MVAMAVFTTRLWRDSDTGKTQVGVSLDRSLSRILPPVLLIQLVLGAILRHTGSGLLLHLSLGVGVLLLVLATGIRAQAQYPHIPVLNRLGRSLMGLITLQLALGLGALIATGTDRQGAHQPTIEVILTTAHQVVGAILLASTVVLALWLHRLVEPEP